MEDIKPINKLEIHRPANKKQNKGKPRRPRGDRPKRIIRLSHEEISDAIKAYLKDGGMIEKLVIQTRSVDEIPVHYEDKFL